MASASQRPGTPGLSARLRRAARAATFLFAAATAAASVAPVAIPSARAADDGPIKVGILHSLSGTMAISETTLKDVMLMLIDEQNKKGGVLGRKLEPVVVDPASNWPLFAEKARELISVDHVSAVFGCWTSVSRKSVLPVFKELDNILFYPVQYEGEESERNVFYTGAAPNQQAIPAVDYLMSEEHVKRWVLAGTDYVYPRTTNKILEAYLKSKGVKDEDIMINYTPFGQSDWQSIVSQIKRFGSAGKKTAVVSTINGDANVPFYKELGNQGIKATDIPVIAFSVGEEELAGIDTKPLVGHLAAWNYFMSVDTPENKAFIERWRAWTKNPKRVSNDPMEAHYIGFNMWVKAVEKAGTTDPDKVIAAMIGVSVPNLSGGYAAMMPNHHITKPVLIGEIEDNGQFNIVSQTPGLIVAQEWSPYLPGSRDLIADWRPPMSCGNYNVKIGKCLGAGSLTAGK
ncbi:urea ABC transporter substrate-binding protein [Acidisphaera rubrifaciens]|uniref:Urea short-chain amide or branched-chain amino acid transporter periplasmic substrate-binding protein n=1 Tax=Acidisphaera rubrifaciens HS-AP3 TaxID=1231350 RepID=A0A0D6P6V4_9PROT|nr:urea ABC transporter substrate-binding protein [Acidisphaera rubrifaciens]GAN77495.1 urea short-chain amide or branched-chain amino acid transporter periplasmic substrate-binding protein [Acidisphaera rubrifaciens HS-AP3]